MKEENRETPQNAPAKAPQEAESGKSENGKKKGAGQPARYELLQQANKKGRHVNGMLMFLRIVLLPVIWMIFPFRIYGKRRVKDGAFIYIGNHYRIWDIAFPPCTTTEGIHYLAKSELRDVPVVGGVCRAVKTIFLERNGDDVRGVMDAIRCLKNGEKIAIYPEGRRNKSEDGELLPFQSGAAMLAIKTRTPVVPILIYKKTRMFRLNHVIIGEPFELDEYYGRKMNQELWSEADEKLRGRLIAMRDEHARMLEEKKGKKKTGK